MPSYTFRGHFVNPGRAGSNVTWNMALRFYFYFCRLQCTVGFLIHGRHARILARVFGVRSEDRGGRRRWGGGREGGREIQFYSTTETEKYSFTVLLFILTLVKTSQNRGKPCLKHPMY